MSICRVCRTPIVFALVANKEGRAPGLMPLNPDPDPDGNVAVHKDVTGRRVGRVVGKNGPHHGYERLMMPHKATCTHPQAQPQNQDVTSLTEWRRRTTKTSRRGRRARPGTRTSPGRQP